MSSSRLRYSRGIFAHRVLFAALLAASTTIGCREAEQIRTYEVDRTIEEENARLAAQWRGKAQTSQPTAKPKPGRLLGALVPHGGQTWIFKVLGDIEPVSRQADAVRKFVESVKFADDRPVWTLPAGWRMRATAGAMRFATLLLDDSEPPLELAVSALPGEQSVADNVNRWRGQVQLPPLVEAEADKSAETLTTAGGPARWVDLSGMYVAGGGMAPFARGATPGASPLPADHPAIPPAGAATGPGAAARKPAADSPIQYEAPADWQAGPATQFSIASFVAEHEGKQVRITLSSAAGDLLSNVNRWRQQIQLPPIDQEALDGAATKLQVGGREAIYVELIGQATPQGQQAVYGVIIPQAAGSSWFVKMMGDASAAFRQREKFLQFVSSFRFVP